MQHARLTEKIKGQASDDRRLAAATILVGAVSSPSRKEKLSNVQLVLSLGVPAGSSSRLAKSATENRVEARDGKYRKFLGQANSKTKTWKLRNEEWQELREECGTSTVDCSYEYHGRSCTVTGYERRYALQL